METFGSSGASAAPPARPCKFIIVTSLIRSTRPHLTARPFKMMLFLSTLLLQKLLLILLLLGCCCCCCCCCCYSAVPAAIAVLSRYCYCLLRLLAARYTRKHEVTLTSRNPLIGNALARTWCTEVRREYHANEYKHESFKTSSMCRCLRRLAPL